MGPAKPVLVDAIVLAALVSGGIALCWTTRAAFLPAELIIYGPALVYLFARSPIVRASLDPSFIVKAVAFCAVFYTYVGVQYNGWTHPSSLPLVWGIPIEQALWGALVIPLSVAVNQRFFASATHNPPLRGARSIIYSLFLAGLAIALLPPLRAQMNGYAYLKIGLMIYPPIFLLALWLDRTLWRELLLTCTAFFIVHLSFEVLAMREGYWGFQGEYVGWVTIAHRQIPIEELVFILVLSSPSVVAVHALRCNWKGLPRPGRPT